MKEFTTNGNYPDRVLECSPVLLEQGICQDIIQFTFLSYRLQCVCEVRCVPGVRNGAERSTSIREQGGEQQKDMSYDLLSLSSAMAKQEPEILKGVQKKHSGSSVNRWMRRTDQP